MNYRVSYLIAAAVIADALTPHSHAPGAAVPFTSFINPLMPVPNGDTVFLNSRGKLCRCSGNN